MTKKSGTARYTDKQIKADWKPYDMAYECADEPVNKCANTNPGI